MTYEEAMDSTVSRAEAKREIDAHDCEGWEAFVADHGDLPSYPGATVLAWLGY